MIISFDPAITGGAYAAANNDAYYVNFLRCVTAIATANAGITSLNVNPYTSTTTIDNTKNCITGIIANTEAGGWLTSDTTHNVTQSGTFVAMSSRATYSGMMKADFYNESGKGDEPYNKMTFHAIGHNQTNTNDAIWHGRWGTTGPLTGWTTAGTGGQLQMTFGCSSTINGDAGYVPSWSTATPNQQASSFTLNGYQSNVAGTSGSATSAGSYPGNACGFNLNNVQNVTYVMAVTANYCIIWEVHRSNNYAGGFSNTYTLQNSNSQGSYGEIMYGGMRTTQPWEDTLAFNNPWVAWHVTHVPSVSYSQMAYNVIDQTYSNQNSSSNFTSWSYQSPQPSNSAAAYMAVSDNAGLISSTATRFNNYPSFQYYRNNINTNHCAVSGTGYQTAAGRFDSFCRNQLSSGASYTAPANPLDLVTPLFHQRQRRGTLPVESPGTSTTHNPNLPTIDSQTGTFVPGAYPIKFARTNTSSWNSGGDCRGIYKSLSMTLANMKLYWQDGQTFTVNGEPYMPIVFHEDMYLIRKM
jgi:hypothetical protein